MWRRQNLSPLPLYIRDGRDLIKYQINPSILFHRDWYSVHLVLSLLNGPRMIHNRGRPVTGLERLEVPQVYVVQGSERI